MATGPAQVGRHVRVAASARELKRRLGPMAWAVLEDVALDASVDEAGRLVATTSSRRIAANLGLAPGTAARALARLRSLGLVSHTRHDGPAGRFGLSAYVLGPVAGLDVVEVVDAPYAARPRPTPPCPPPPHLAPPRAVGAHMVEAETAGGDAGNVAGSGCTSIHDDDAAALAAAVDDLPAEERARSAQAAASARRGRRASTRADVQLSILDATFDSDRDTKPHGER